ncbi:MAG: hypothetical protein IJ809_02990 [Clostridia bacterium]|nr:hypothetical protein [Clostridia bacterium]
MEITAERIAKTAKLVESYACSELTKSNFLSSLREKGLSITPYMLSKYIQGAIFHGGISPSTIFKLKSKAGNNYKFYVQLIEIFEQRRAYNDAVLALMHLTNYAGYFTSPKHEMTKEREMAKIFLAEIYPETIESFDILKIINEQQIASSIIEDIEKKYPLMP